MWTYNYTDELYHHGIKGMKWGIRRFQRKDGTLTSSGKKRYSDSDPKTKSKSKHRQRLEDQFRQTGMSKKEAEIAADKRIRTEKILATAAGLTVAACAAYAINSKMKNRVDQVIKAGSTLQRIEMQDTGGKLHDTFYAAKGKHDNKRYYGLLGYTRKQQTGQAFVMKLQAANDVKVASKDNAAKVFGDLYKNDSSFRDSVKDQVSKHFNGSNKVNPDDLSPKNVKKMYENFNCNLIQIRESKSGADRTFYNKLKSAGYGAIQDINDMKYSGYNAKNPLIIFDNPKNNIMVKSMDEIKQNMFGSAIREQGKAAVEQVVDDMMKKIGPVSAVALTGAAVQTYRSDPRKNVNAEFDKIGGK